MAVKTYTIIASATEETATVRTVADIITTADSALISDNGPLCEWFAVQNKDAAQSLYVQSSSATSGNANVELNSTLGQYKLFPPSDRAKYDLETHYIRVGANNQVFSIEVMWG